MAEGGYPVAPQASGSSGGENSQPLRAEAAESAVGSLPSERTVQRSGLRPKLERGKTAGSGHMFGPEVDTFLVSKKLGRGGQGSVHLCTRLNTGRSYAVKIINVENMRFSKKHHENLRQEIRNMSELHHPRIVNLHADIWEDGMCYLVLDLASGGDLHHKVETEAMSATKSGRVFHGLGGNEICTRHVAQQLVEGIAYMHAKGIVHRDLKLENILVAATRQTPDTPPLELHDVKIADLGLSKFVGARDPDKTLTRRNSIVGSPDFVAPEVLGAVYDERADYWSLGVMIYAMFCGQWPFEIASQADLAPSRHREIVSTVRDNQSWQLVSEQAKQLVLNLLKVDPDERLGHEELRNHHWLYPDAAADSVSVPRSFSQPDAFDGVIKRISGYIGAALDSIQFRFADGTKQDHGNKGGELQKVYNLKSDEIVIAVMQEDRGQYLGNEVTFFTSRGRILSIRGTQAKNRGRFVAPAGTQVVGLQFDDSALVGIIIEVNTGSGGAVESIGGRVGYCLDKVYFKMRNGQVREYGEEGGTEIGPFPLQPDEHIMVVEQGRRDAFLGINIMFYTSAGRIIKVTGMQSGDSARFAASAGYQICGLEFKGSRLSAVHVCSAFGFMEDVQVKTLGAS